MRYEGVNGITPAQICVNPGISFYITCCMPPAGVVIHRILPVFEPNDYFWKHHWQEGQDKGQVYANAVR